MATAAPAGESFALDESPPAFAGAQPDRQVLWYVHDRLARIEIGARWPAGDAAARFARACVFWLRHSPASVSAAADRSPESCAGRDGDIDFRARLDLIPDSIWADVALTLTAAASATDAAAAGTSPGAKSTP